METEQLEQVSEEILNKLDEAKAFALFRHIFPDWDAKGSQKAMQAFLEKNYPDKKVTLYGSEEEGSLQDLKEALAIILDTSTEARVDGEWKEAKDSLRIDHHIQCENFSNLEYIDSLASATCEILALLFKKWGREVDEKTAQLLYQGLIADNLNFSVENVTPKTFEAAAFLLEKGARPVDANLEVFAGNYDDFAYENKVRSHACRRENFLYSIMDAKDYLLSTIDFASAKEKVYVLGSIRQIEIWALFTMNPDGLTYRASLRSRKLEVRDIAEQYGGGGHRCAAGIKELSLEQMEEIINLLSERSKEPY